MQQGTWRLANKALQCAHNQQPSIVIDKLFMHTYTACALANTCMLFVVSLLTGQNLQAYLDSLRTSDLAMSALPTRSAYSQHGRKNVWYRSESNTYRVAIASVPETSRLGKKAVHLVSGLTCIDTAARLADLAVLAVFGPTAAQPYLNNAAEQYTSEEQKLRQGVC